MKIAILGGSFNPPHIGHLFICSYVFACADVEQVWCIPCYQHAFGKSLAAFEHRLAMCELALSAFRENAVNVLSIERDRQGTSWTIDTVRYLRKNYPDIDFTWIIGSDVLNELEQWKDFDELQRLIDFLVVPRAGSLSDSSTVRQACGAHGNGNSSSANRLNHLKQQRDALTELDIYLPNVSSTVIRERVKQAQSIRHLVPDAIVAYISTHNLYLENEPSDVYHHS